MTAIEPLPPIPDSSLPSELEALSIDQAAGVLGISSRLVRALCASGRLAAVDLGSGRNHKWRISREAIRDLLNSGAKLDRNLLP